MASEPPLNPYQQRLLQNINADIAETSPSLNPYQARVQRIVADRPADDGDGVLSAVGRFASNVGELFLPSENERRGIAVAGAVSAGILQPLQSLAQIPGLFTEKTLATDKAADFLERASAGLLHNAEREAMLAGLTEQEIADAHLFGEMVGYTVPVIGALKAARLVTRTTGAASELSAFRNFNVDVVGGAIFGAALRPSESIEERGINLVKESALFGTGNLVLNGLSFAFAGWRAGRANMRAGKDHLDELLTRVRNGERVVLNEDDLGLFQLLNEEGYIAASPQAHNLLSQFDVENSLLAGIRSSTEAGYSMGIVRGLSHDFSNVSAAVDKYRQAFPHLKFDAARGTEGYNVYFGLKGLTNQQRRQLKLEGRISGMAILKGGTTYEYVRPGKGGKLIVRTVDGKTATISPRGATDLSYAAEDIKLPTAGQALFEDFRSFAYTRITQAANTGGVIPEEQIIRGLRDGTIQLGDDARRAFDISGAIVYPEEMGLTGTGTATGFVQSLLQEGKKAGDLLPPTPVRPLEDLFELWMKDRGLPIDAADVEQFRTSFAQQLRTDLWKQVPEEDMAIFRALREENLALIEEQGLSLEALASTKGFNVERIPDTGQVVLRDINTGARWSFGSDAIAEEGLTKIIRAEKDPFNLFLSPGHHGMPGFTGGGSLADDYIAPIGGDVLSRDFLVDIPTVATTNRRDFFRRVEELIGIPLFSKGFAPIDEAILNVRRLQEPISDRIHRAWKGLKRDQKIEVAEFWVGLEGKKVTTAQAIKLARQAGLNSKQIRAFAESRSLFDLGAQMMGLPESRYIPVYYSRIRPIYERGGRPNIKALLSDDPAALREFEFWADMARTGDLPQLELDPEIVMHKYFRSLLYKQHVKPLEDPLRALVDLKVKDLPLEQRQLVLQRAVPGTTGDSYVLHDVVRSTLQEYLNNVRGNTAPGFGSVRRITMRMFRKLGMETDELLFDELHNLYLTTQYGAALGIRWAPINRNAMQNVWMMYTRVGGKHGTEALRRAVTQEGFDKWRLAGAVRDVGAGIPQHDAIFQSWIDSGVAVKGHGPISNALAASVRRALRLGQVSRKTAQKLLVPYGSSDQINRAWAAEWQYLHTAEKLSLFDAGKLSWDKFLEDGLPYFSPAIKDTFVKQYNAFGREKALQWIGKQAADESNFIYGSASTPTWMQRPFGRLIGVFGQWPLWAFEMYGRRMAHATPGQIGAFWARNAILMGAMTNIGMQTGINVWNWMAPASLEYGGGPFADVLIDLRAVISDPVDQKGPALRRLGRDAGGLVLPGQTFFYEVDRARQQTTPEMAVLSLALGRPADVGNFAYEYVYPEGALDTPPRRISPEQLPALPDRQ